MPALRQQTSWQAASGSSASSCHASTDQACLDALVTLLELKFVDVDKLSLQQPRSNSASAWQEVKIFYCQYVTQLAMLPLATTTQRVAANGVSIKVPDLVWQDGRVSEHHSAYAEQLAAQRRAIQAVAAVGELQWGGELTIKCVDAIPDDSEMDGLSPAVQALQRHLVQATISNAAPLAARSCHSLILWEHVPPPYTEANGPITIDTATIALVGASLGAGLTSFWLCNIYIGPSVCRCAAASAPHQPPDD